MSFGNDYLNFASMGVLGNTNPADKAMDYYKQIPGATQQYYQPYMQYGEHPGESINEIGSHYHQSPGFQFALQQALQGGNHAAAAGGMAGSPQHEQQNMGLATNLANQDYNQFLQNAMGLIPIGYNASNQMGQNIAQSLAQQGNLQFTGDAWKQQMRGQGIKNWADLAGAAIGKWG